jgi:glycosyltransferase involved in cell wall biosynthesis
MKIGIVNPYFDSFGGGERYVLSLASHWSDNHQVSIFWDNSEILTQSESRFGLDLSKVKIVPNIFSNNNIVQKVMVTLNYDVLFFLSDGSIPTSLAKHNILHFQVPFNKLAYSPLKMLKFDATVCNSKFTQANLDQKFRRKSVIIYPPVTVSDFKPVIKQKIILSVGRFSANYQAKKPEILISTFKDAYKSGKITDYKLIFVGGVLDEDISYLNILRLESDGFPIEFYPNCDYEKLKYYYSVAKFYWHAAGFGETDPTKMEHFGITTVEAMAAGCIPFVYAGGGQPEIISQGLNGYLWTKPEELIFQTMKLITKPNPDLITNAQKKALDYDIPKFNQAYDKLLNTITS